mgnify:CR=1 FL=1
MAAAEAQAHDAVLSVEAAESRMGDMALFGQREMPIRTMFYQLVAHDMEHTVHAAKTLRDIGKVSTEAQLILGLLQEAEGRLEALLAGLSDQDIDRLKEAPIKELIITDTISVKKEKKLPNMKIVSVANVFGEAIKRIHNGESVSALFDL